MKKFLNIGRSLQDRIILRKIRRRVQTDRLYRHAFFDARIEAAKLGCSTEELLLAKYRRAKRDEGICKAYAAQKKKRRGRKTDGPNYLSASSISLRADFDGDRVWFSSRPTLSPIMKVKLILMNVVKFAKR